MKRNMQRTYGVPFSGRVMTKLIDKGFSREQAYDTVQPRAMQAWEEQRQFRDIIESTPEITSVLSPEEIDDAFNPTWHLKHVDTIFKRLELI
jgi:adenylosuccinate lyase